MRGAMQATVPFRVRPLSCLARVRQRQCSAVVTEADVRTWSPQHEAASDSERQAGSYYMQALYTRWLARAFTLLYHTKRNRKPQATMTGKVCNPRPLKLLPRLMVADRKTKTERQRHR